jgi:UDP-2,3-diacylglucosamine hydrolase
MSHTLFISDLHLGADQPASTDLFLNFVQHIAPAAESLYILGDLFEYWAGDDDLDEPFHQTVTSALQKLARGGTHVYLMRGNRDLLMDKALEQACEASLLPDPTLIDLYGRPVLLTHGDLLCTDDHEYQAYRKQVHDPEFQRQFLAQPLEQRKTLIAQLRTLSQEEKRSKPGEIMDVNAEAVAAMLREHGYPHMIHGHTHRPGHHLHYVDGHNCERWVLSDWHRNGDALRCDAQGCYRMGV